MKTNVTESRPGYYGRDYYVEANTSTWLCNSCGARAVNLELKDVIMSLKRVGGIKVAVGAFGDGYDDGKVAINVVNTKNGPLTISTRYVY